MNYKSISYSLGLFCFPISFLSFVNILYSSYFDYFLSVQSYAITLFVSLFLGIVLYFFGKNIEKKINFYEQIILIILVYFTIFCLIAAFSSGFFSKISDFKIIIPILIIYLESYV